MKKDVATLEFADLVEGLERSFQHQLEEAELDRFAELSGDYSPLHMDPEFARSRGFEGRVAHGALISAFISRLVGMMLPGRSAIIQTTQCTFHKPTYANCTLEISGKVARRLDALNSVMLNISVRKISGNEKIELVSGKVQLGFMAEGKGKK